MENRSVPFLLVAVLVAAVVSWWWLRVPAPVAYVGGPVLAMDEAGRTYGGVLVHGEQIVAVGTADQIRSLAGKGARIVDLGGRALLPGFVDAHGHFPGAGLDAVMADLTSPPVGKVRSLDDLLAVLRREAAAMPAGKWLQGWGYDDTLLAEKRHPTREDLDSISRDRPIWILHVSGHLGVANTAALAAAGIERDTADPEGGVIRRDPATGEPNGVLEEAARWTMQAAVPDFSLREQLAIVRRAIRRYAEAGVTTAQNGLAEKAHIEGLGWLSWLGVLPLRLVVWPEREVADEMLAGTYDPTCWNGSRIRVGAVKLVADGSIQGYTGYLREPYFTPHDDDASYRGYPTIEPDELAGLVARFHRAGYQVAVHGNGDAAIDDILAAFESAQQELPRPDARHVVIHAQMARRDQLERMKAIGLVPSFFVLHTFYWGDRHREIFLGPERAARISPTRTAGELGVRFTLHNDTPVVPMDPLATVWAAVNRQTSGGASLGPEERIDVERALRAVTIDAAWQMFLENEVGSIEPGKRADLVVLDRDPRTDAATIRDVRVLETIVGGQTVWTGSGFGSLIRPRPTRSK